MKRLFVILLFCFSSLAYANPYGHHGRHGGGHHGHGHHGHGHHGWIAPLIIGGVVTYALTRPQQPVVVQQSPIIVQQPSPIVAPPPGYHYEHILDANCSCYRLALIPN